LKPDHPDEDYPHSVINEWFVMRLAKRLGLDVPDVHRRYAPSPVFLINRFDRVREDQGWQRRHVIDACQLLGLDRSFKYSQVVDATHLGQLRAIVAPEVRTERRIRADAGRNRVAKGRDSTSRSEHVKYKAQHILARAKRGVDFPSIAPAERVSLRSVQRVISKRGQQPATTPLSQNDTSAPPVCGLSPTRGVAPC
jgi:hypothetical protein